MKTTVDIPEAELKDAMRFTKAKTKREAVVKVLEDFNRRRRMAELVKYAGTFSDSYPTNDEIEAVDERRDRRHEVRVASECDEGIELRRTLDDDLIGGELLQRPEHRPGRARAVVPDAEHLDACRHVSSRHAR